MEPDSSSVEWIAIGAAVIAAVATGAVWSLGRGVARQLIRSVSVLCCLSLTAAAGLLWANHVSEVYPTWASLTGSSDAVALAAAPGSAGKAGSGRITSFTFTGARSGFRLPVYAYLPAGYATHPTTRYPVIEALGGFPGSPMGWLRMLNAAKILNGEIGSGRMAPTVVLFPYQTPKPTLDTECTNMVGGPQAETYVTHDVPAAAATRLHIRTDPGSWGLIGYSAGGYCASDLLLRHPTQYVAAASLSGYATPGIRVGNGSENTSYNDVWRLHHLPVPAVALYLTCARSDTTSMRNTALLAGAVRAPLSVTTAYINGGGHNGQSWQAMEAPALDWLSGRLAKPVTSAVSTTGRQA